MPGSSTSLFVFTFIFMRVRVNLSVKIPVGGLKTVSQRRVGGRPHVPITGNRSIIPELTEQGSQRGISEIYHFPVGRSQNTIAARIFARYETDPAGGTTGHDIMLLQLGTLCSKPIQVRGLYERTMVAHIVPAQVIGQYENDIRIGNIRVIFYHAVWGLQRIY